MASIHPFASNDMSPAHPELKFALSVLKSHRMACTTQKRKIRYFGTWGFAIGCALMIRWTSGFGPTVDLYISTLLAYTQSMNEARQQGAVQMET